MKCPRWNELTEAEDVCSDLWSVLRAALCPDRRRLGERSSKDPFHSVCELSGGMVFWRHPIACAKNWTRFVSNGEGALHCRISAAVNATAGEHGKG